ncbi:hypothetical protein BGZ72_009660 [Mortierella alpina]|nr:hypothetical protein BGZ72_009660 [Mortierella alpina]
MYLRSITAIIVSLAAATTALSVPFNNRIVNGIPVQKAGHCLVTPNTSENTIGGAYLGGTVQKTGKLVKAVKSFSHDNYVHKASANDIGIVFLSEKVDGPYASTEGGYPEGGSKLTVAGYGDLSPAGPASQNLLKVQVTIGNETDCLAHKNNPGRIFDPKTQVCATDNGHSACLGDSGGPLYSGSGKDVHVVGVVSGAGDVDRCGEKGSYQYFTFIAPFAPRIKSKIEEFEKDGANATAKADASM